MSSVRKALKILWLPVSLAAVALVAYTSRTESQSTTNERATSAPQRPSIKPATSPTPTRADNPVAPGEAGEDIDRTRPALAPSAQQPRRRGFSPPLARAPSTADSTPPRAGNIDPLRNEEPQHVDPLRDEDLGRPDPLRDEDIGRVDRLRDEDLLSP